VPDLRGRSFVVLLAPHWEVPYPRSITLRFWREWDLWPFSGATHTPIACTIMGMELFGIESGLFIGLGCFIAYLSGPVEFTIPKL
jgi:hypothetical protein